MWIDFALKVFFSLTMIIVVMTIAGYSVLAERKVSSWIQGRVGPNRTIVPLFAYVPVLGRFLQRLGVFQLPADGLKFLFKEEIIPGHVNKLYYNLAPVVSLIPALLTMAAIPFGAYTNAEGEYVPLILANVDIGILFVFAFSSLAVYGIVLAGWAANSKYPFLGGIRASAQMISYELAMGASLLPLIMFASSLSLVELTTMQATWWNILVFPLSGLIFLVALFAETNRAPFDMAESETDLVGGFHTEYGAFKFGIFFTAEYAHIVIGSALFVLLFLGGWQIPFVGAIFPEGWVGAVLSTGIFLLKTFALIFFFIWIRWTLPRFRYDQVMKLGWEVLLPLSILNLVVYALIMMLIY